MYNTSESKKDLPTNSPLRKLHPIIDQEGLLRVGGHITQSDLHQNETKPLLIPGKHHVATLLIRHHHEKVMHQGRYFTEGAIRANGLWIVGAKRCISSILHKCVSCHKLRGRVEHQQMADLPTEHLHMEPPFSSSLDPGRLQHDAQEKSRLIVRDGQCYLLACPRELSI